MQLKPYQTDAVKSLLERSGRFLRQNGGKKMIFKSPTGSGKTVMMAELLKQLADSKTPRPLSFIWAAPRQLHIQSREKLENYYAESMALACSDFNGLADRQIGENEVLFLNWESIRQRDKNTIVKENERDFYLDKVVENTRENGRDIVLVIDESHHHATSEISRQLIADIAPKLTIEVSATPNMEGDDKFSVPLEEVKLAGMIKKSVLLNENFKNLLAGDKIKPGLLGKADTFVLKQALAKRGELAAAFHAAGVGVNPLLCIQLPDRKTQQEDDIKTGVVRTLKRAGITTANGKLAVYLSDEKKNLENISRNDNRAEVMIFKQAIALGWDCPRAHILVLFRDWKSVVFSVQTLGRIMRMPQPDVGHYGDEILNQGYVYTNLPEITVSEDVAGGYVSIHTSKRIEAYAPIALSSVHRRRQREKTRLSPLFNKLFLQAADEYGLAEKLKMQNQKVQRQFIADYESSDIDVLAGEQITGNVRADVIDDYGLQRLFDYFVNANLSPYYPEDRSIGRVKDAIYDFFRVRKGMDYANCFDAIINIALSDGNKPHIQRVLKDAKDLYAAGTGGREEPLQKTDPWELPQTINYGDKHVPRKADKSAMRPFYAANSESRPEKEFIDFLENTASVKWWYKNGEGESLYFAVPYTENGGENPFYVDFIVQFNDGTIGLYDTKSGITADVAKNKSDGLLAYIRNANRKRKRGKLTGGIVTPASRADYSQWKVYTGRGAHMNSRDLSNWDWLQL